MARALAADAETAAHIQPIHAPDSPIVGLLRACERIAPSDSTVLLTGETGTGKEVFARYIHQRSSRAKGPLVPVNCGAIPETLLESELFGFVRGAFTGATQGRKGRIALAEGGTLFLDEVGEMPLALQVKLLRVLQERKYEAVGSSDLISANFRLVAATNRDLAAEVEAGRFRRDLYYRLLVCPLELPTLRQRATDIAMLFQFFWKERGDGRPVDAGVLELLRRYDWPGNVRELENLVERLSVISDGPTIGVDDLPPAIRALATPGASAPSVSRPQSRERQLSGLSSGQLREDEQSALREEMAAMRAAASAPSFFNDPEPSPTTAAAPPLIPAEVTLPVDLPALLRSIEDAHIDAALAQTDGNRKAAAALLGLQRTTLVEKLRRRTPPTDPSGSHRP